MAMLEAHKWAILVEEFGSDIEKIADNLYAAKKGKLKAEETPSAVEAGKAKLAEYQKHLEELKGAKRSELIDTFGNTMKEIEKFLGELESK